MTSVDIAVVIVNWNKKDDVLKLLKQLAEVSEPSFDVFVVDNASTDNSVVSMRENFPDISLIINNANLGGTGGFNSGIDHVLKKGIYSYIWLLDNDAEIKNDTLLELYKKMESDFNIGLAGSRIVDIDNKEVTVEAGSNFRWDIIGVIPVQQNVKNFRSDADTINVDYVAICSALVRVNALKHVGLMDDRLFLLWDDMDWGLNFNKKGFKVVAATKSVAFHGSFSERNRGEITNFYYGVRNSFLVYSKHTGFLRRARIFYRSLRCCHRDYYIMKTLNRKYAAKLIRTAINDYIQNRWGKFSSQFINQKTERLGDLLLENENNKKRKILVSLSGTGFSETKILLESLKKQYPVSEITVMVHDHRTSYYDNYQIYQLDIKKMHNLWYVLRKFIDIYRKQYDIFAYMTPTPFAGAVRRSISLNKEGKVISKSSYGYLMLPIQAVALIMAELKTFLIFPVMMYKSIQYRNCKVKAVDPKNWTIC